MRLKNSSLKIQQRNLRLESKMMKMIMAKKYHLIPLPWKQTHKPQFTDFSETTIQTLKMFTTVREPDTGMHACMVEIIQKTLVN